MCNVYCPDPMFWIVTLSFLAIYIMTEEISPFCNNTATTAPFVYLTARVPCGIDTTHLPPRWPLPHIPRVPILHHIEG